MIIRSWNTRGLLFISVRVDLTIASSVHILEPQWNPMVEEQAANRIHRIGQLSNVLITRYITRQSIEEVSQKVRRGSSSGKNI